MAPKSAQTVDEFMERLTHPFKEEVVALRQIILAADPRIHEGIKWNAPSFAIGEHFATFHLHAKNGVQLVLHRGAKVRDMPDHRIAIPDSMSMLDWRSNDRAIAQFANMEDVEAKQAALQDIIRAWIVYV